MHKSIELCDGLSLSYIRDIENFIAEWESNSSSIIVQTSGSTGAPKQIEISKDRIRNSAIATGKFFNFQPGQRLLLNLSPNYIAGKLMIVRALLHQMKIVVSSLEHNPLLNLREMNLDFAAFVPYQIQAIFNDSSSIVKYEKISQVIIGGAPLSEDWLMRLSICSNKNFATFGMTETITHFALKNISNQDDYYACLPGISIDVDERGCLVINKNKISEKLITNDLIDKIDDQHFRWIGRIDNVINSAGIKISPELVEQKIQHLLKSNFFIHGRKSERFGEEAVLYIEGDSDQNSDEIKGSISQVLEVYEQPKEIIFIHKFERTDTSKIIRKNYV